MKDISPALSRSYGFLGFMLFGLGTMYIGNEVFGLGLDPSNLRYSAGGGKGMGLIAISIALAFVGMFIGWRIGSGIKINGRNAGDININPLLLYGANGSFMWLFSLSALSLAIGKEGAKEIIFSSSSYQLFLFVIGICLLGSLLISLMMFLSQSFRNGS